MGLDLEYINGQTPLDEYEKEGLRIPTITTRGELDEFEQQNIEKAVQWTMAHKFNIQRILTEDFAKTLHKKMLEDVWEWAGKFRTTEKSIGVDPIMIGIDLRNLIDDCRYWVNNNTFEPDEIAVRYSHRIVKIHLFPNGNGRHSRLIGDVLVNHGFEKPLFSWGNGNLINHGQLREQYLSALREADDGDYTSLIEFARK